MIDIILTNGDNFPERYHFKIRIDSNRCRVIPGDGDICPGDIHLCPGKYPDDCFNSGTSIHIKFQSILH